MKTQVERGSAHGIKKGNATSFSSGTTLPPPLVSIAARGDWSLSGVLGMCWKLAEPGNCHLGSCLTGIGVNSADFMVLPPHFREHCSTRETQGDANTNSKGQRERQKRSLWMSKSSRRQCIWGRRHAGMHCKKWHCTKAMHTESEESWRCGQTVAQCQESGLLDALIDSKTPVELSQRRKVHLKPHHHPRCNHPMRRRSNHPTTRRFHQSMTGFNSRPTCTRVHWQTTSTRQDSRDVHAAVQCYVPRPKKGVSWLGWRKQRNEEHDWSEDQSIASRWPQDTPRFGQGWGGKAQDTFCSTLGVAFSHGTCILKVRRKVMERWSNFYFTMRVQKWTHSISISYVWCYLRGIPGAYVAQPFFCCCFV